PAAADRQLMLYESGEDVVSRGRRVEGEEAFAVILVGHEAIADAPRHFLTRPDREPMLELAIDGVEIVEVARVIAVRLVVVDAQLHLRVAGSAPAIPPEHVAAADPDAELAGGTGSSDDGDRRRNASDVAAIEISLDRQ